MPLMLTCRNCHKPFRAGIQLDQKSFQDPSTQLINNSEQCSNCQQSAIYNKTDYRWQP